MSDVTDSATSNNAPDDNTQSVVGFVQRAGERSEALLARFVEGLTARQVFGEPERVGERVVITAAAIQRSGGYGFGGGGDDEVTAGMDGGAGGGGGGHGEARPVAVIEVGPDGVKVRAVLDFTKIGLTVLAGAFAVWRAGRRS